MPYANITFSQAKQLLADRLVDSGKQYFTDTELGLYIIEALQVFNALANYYRQEFVFPTTNSVTWYDLTDTTNLPATLRPLTTTSTALLSLIEYHLLEPQTSSYPLTWAGSNQFTLSDILSALQQLCNQTLSDSSCTVRQSLVNATPGRTFLGDRTIDLRRVAWIPMTGLGYSLNTLLPSDLWAQQSFEAAFPQATPGIPMTYRKSTEPPLGFDVDVQPGVPGQYDLLTVNADLDFPVSSASTLSVPDDWCWVVKWGAMAQLFGRGSVSADPLRAQYCQMRYQQGIAAMRNAPALLGARINDIPAVVESITNGDFYDANWQGRTGTPRTSIYYAGLNMLALSPVPNFGLYSVTASVVRNMVLPVLETDYLQVGKDDLNAVIGEAQHIAMFKCGGEEFISTFPLHGDFLRHCAYYNAKLKALSPYLEFLDGRGQSDNRIHPVFEETVAVKE